MVEVDPLGKQRSRMVDWTERRTELVQLSNPTAFESMQIKVLSYLIERYRDSPIAEVAARFCNRDRLYLNRRMIVVHEHLRLDRGQPTCSRSAAEQRVKLVVGKLADQCRGSLHDPIVNSDRVTCTTDLADEFETETPRTPRQPRLFQRWLSSLMTWGTTIVGSDRWLRNQIANSRTLSRTNIKKLVSRVANTKTQDMAALGILSNCNSENLLRMFVRLWRIRVVAEVPQDRVLAGLKAELCRESRMIRAAEQMREMLGDDHVEVRLAAIRLLERIGNLDDISFFGDLLQLPPEEVSSEEAAAMVQAMQTLAQGE